MRFFAPKTKPSLSEDPDKCDPTEDSPLFGAFYLILMLLRLAVAGFVVKVTLFNIYVLLTSISRTPLRLLTSVIKPNLILIVNKSG